MEAALCNCTLCCLMESIGVQIGPWAPQPRCRSGASMKTSVQFQQKTQTPIFATTTEPPRPRHSLENCSCRRSQSFWDISRETAAEFCCLSQKGSNVVQKQHHFFFVMYNFKKNKKKQNCWLRQRKWFEGEKNLVYVKPQSRKTSFFSTSVYRKSARSKLEWSRWSVVLVVVVGGGSGGGVAVAANVRHKERHGSHTPCLEKNKKTNCFFFASTSGCGGSHRRRRGP